MFIKLIMKLIPVIFLMWTGLALAQEQRKIEYGLLAGVSLNNYVGEDTDDFSMKIGFNVAFAARYYFLDNLFLESGLGFATKGYKYELISSSGQYWDYDGLNYDSKVEKKMSTYNLDLPVLIGYRFNLTDDVNLKVKVGPYVTYALSGELTTKGYNTVYPNIHESETEHFDYSYKIKDLDDFKRFGCGLSAGIDVNYKSFSVCAKCQRGLTKTYKDREVYEQNMLLSLGYCI